MVKPIICGLDSYKLLSYEKKLLKKHRPLGVILFPKNIVNKQQLISLVADIKATLNHKYVIVAIDQEGGRVQRIKQPICKNHLSAMQIGSIEKKYGVLKAQQFALLHAYFIGLELKQFGINTNFAPVADIYYQDANNVIGDRAYSNNAHTVSKLVNSAAKGFLRAGIAPVTKHIPGHGRTKIDTHKEKSYVNASLKELLATDFIPFKNQIKDIKMSMVAHIYYNKLDSKNPATTSCIIAKKIIPHYLNFNDILISDCISMNALDGTLVNKAKKILESGTHIVLSSWDSEKEKELLLESIAPLAENNFTLKTVAKALCIAKNNTKNYNKYLHIYNQYQEILANANI